MTSYWYNCVSVTFQFLYYFSALQFPQVYTVVFGSTDDVFPICHRKGRWKAEFRISMASVRFQKFPLCEVPKPLLTQKSELQMCFETLERKETLLEMDRRTMEETTPRAGNVLAAHLCSCTLLINTKTEPVVHLKIPSLLLIWDSKTKLFKVHKN